MSEDQVYKYALNPLLGVEYDSNLHFCRGVSCDTGGMGAPYGDERNPWLDYHLSWYHKLWYKIKEDPAMGIFRIV